MSEDQLHNLWAWLWRLVIFGVIDMYDYDVTLGHAYGFKDCCIKNFLNLTKLGYHPAEWMWENIDKRLLYNTRFDYVPCVICLEKEFLL